MSWAEIKKAVNSNLAVPLNEKIDELSEKVGCVDGIIPRGITKHSVSVSGKTAQEILSVTGSGYVMDIFAGGHNSSYGYYYGILTVYIDEGEEDAKTIVVNGGGYSGTDSGIQYDVTAPMCDIDMTSDAITIATTRDTAKVCYINKPFVYKKSLRVGYGATDSGVTGSASATINYTLEL